MIFAGKRVLITGATGTIGNALVRRLLSGEHGLPDALILFSRDEAKQHAMRLRLAHRAVATDDVIYENSDRVRFQIGDISDYDSVRVAIRDVDIVLHAAALKQVPTCEYFPFEAVKTNVHGARNLVRAIREGGHSVELVVGISTDKACKPVNVYGMTKAIAERVLTTAALDCPDTRFVIARYGNVLASRGSVIPLFHEQIKRGGPVTLTEPAMTRFLLTMDEAVDTIFATATGDSGETYVPHGRGVRIVDLAAALIGERSIETVFTGIRPGEKLDEILISEEEAPRTVDRGDHRVVLPILPQLRPRNTDTKFDGGELSSARVLLDRDGLAQFLAEHGLRVEDEPQFVT